MAGRASISIVLFLVCLSAFANVLVLSGAADGLGLAPNPDGSKTSSGGTINDSTGSARNISSGGQTGGTIVPLITKATSAIGSFLNILFRGPAMLVRIGLPSWFTPMVLPVLTILAGVALVYALSGRAF